MALACLGVARGAKVIAQSQLDAEQVSEPYAPSPTAAPYLSLGYREAMADMIFVRLRGYFGDPAARVDSIASLCEAIVTLDARLHIAYEFCGNAMTFINFNSPNAIYLRAITLLERGAREYPKDWRIPMLAGQIYTQDLKTDDPAQRREWDEKGTLLVESAIRKPGAPAELGDWAAVMRTKYGQRERAVEGLREMILVTSDTKARKVLIERLAKLQKQDADEIASELYEARKDFTVEWQTERPMLSATWYILLGNRLRPGIDMGDLATGGHDLVVQNPIEQLEPL
jgi:hypothetical protein